MFDLRKVDSIRSEHDEHSNSGRNGLTGIVERGVSGTIRTFKCSANWAYIEIRAENRSYLR